MVITGKGALLLAGVAVLAFIGASMFWDSPGPPPVDDSALLTAGPVATVPGFRKPAPPPSAPSTPAAPAEPGRLTVVPETVAVEAPPGGMARAAIRVTNSGGERLPLTLALTGDGAYSIEGPGCLEALDPGQFCLLTLAFRPVSEGSPRGELLVQPARGDGSSVLITGTSQAPARAAPAPTAPDTTRRDRMRAQRLAGLPQGVGEPPPANAPKAVVEQYDARQREFNTINTSPAPSMSQPNYGGYASYVSSLPVDSCRVIGADSVIEARTSSYIDSSQCGEVRATIDRHVYNSGGNGTCRNVLIPAGSTLIGECTSVGGSQERIDVRWRRIIRAGDRSHILIEEAASDALGRKGLPGHVDGGVERALLATVIGAVANAATGGLVGALDRSTISSAVDITTGLATSVQSGRSVAGEAARAFAQSMGDGIRPLVEQEIARLRAQNPVVVPPGTRVTIIPTTDLWIRSPGDGPMVMGDARGTTGERLNPQFQSNAAIAAQNAASTLRRDAASVGSQPGSTSTGSLGRPGTIQQSGQVLTPGVSGSLGGSNSGAVVQRIGPGSNW